MHDQTFARTSLPVWLAGWLTNWLAGWLACPPTCLHACRAGWLALAGWLVFGLASGFRLEFGLNSVVSYILLPFFIFP